MMSIDDLFISTSETEKEVKKKRGKSDFGRKKRKEMMREEKAR